MNSDYNTAKFNALYNARYNLLEMLSDQGYDTSNYDSFKSNELHSMIKHAQLDMLIAKKDGSQKVYTKFFEICEKKPKLLNKQVIDNMVEDLFVLEELLTTKDTLIIVTHSDANDTVKTHVKHLWSLSNYNVIVIDIKSLQFNILKHKYVPPHKTLTAEESETFRKKYNISNDEQIPEISRFDPVARIICMKPGEICEITRASKNAVSAPYYRICKNK